VRGQSAGYELDAQMSCALPDSNEKKPQTDTGKRCCDGPLYLRRPRLGPSKHLRHNATIFRHDSSVAKQTDDDRNRYKDQANKVVHGVVCSCGLTLEMCGARAASVGTVDLFCRGQQHLLALYLLDHFPPPFLVISPHSCVTASVRKACFCPRAVAQLCTLPENMGCINTQCMW
jgi:hypothetical protein